MKSAELSKSKRIRHCFPLKEIYHRFIHSEEYAYTPYNSRQISCKGNYLVLRDIGKKYTIQDIEEMWRYNSERMIAIIDRKLKRILINKSITDYYYYQLIRAIPDNYNIYLTDVPIPNKDVLRNKKEYLNIHAKYIIKRYVEHQLMPFYSVLYGNKKTLNINPDITKSDSYIYREVINFINNNNLHRHAICKKCFDTEYKLRIPIKKWSSITKEIKLPTLQQIITNTVFTKEEKLILEQRVFWTKYCNGNQIPFKDVTDNWNKEITQEEIIKYFNKKGHYVNPEIFTIEHTWNDYIARVISWDEEIENNIIKENIKKSEANFLEAKAKLIELNNNSYTIEDWRNRKIIPTNKVKYIRYLPSYKRNVCGLWIDSYLSTSDCKNIFINTQLRLYNNNIETSKHAVVPLSEGVKMYKMFIKARTNNPNTTTWTTSNFGNIKVGIYNLRFITYKDKISDDGNYLGYKEWLIQIGCHSLWLDDINEFIKYYHLEKEFGLN